MSYPRFTKIIINHFLSLHKSIPKGLSSCLNTIKDDGVIYRLKFVNKGEDFQEYGRAILDTMLTDEIKHSEAYQAFITYSTGLIPPKKTKEIQQAGRDETLVPTAERVKISSTNMRIDPTMTQKEETFQVVLDLIKASPCYNAFLVTADVPEIYMQEFWFTIKKIKKTTSYEFDLADKKCKVDVELFRMILGICP
uniref:Uncharacterized protein n=1 Tax=Tanacetum cinerariifolium TaxID=118510 RepID=A0A699Q034_TANCI|nr:hypothetical protein [Tanacetum cinerariifolium]